LIPQKTQNSDGRELYRALRGERADEALEAELLWCACFLLVPEWGKG
jgi:hypothetical protein